MKCGKVQELISLYLDNKLSSAETEHLKRHLESCSFCKKEYIAARNIKNLLSGLKSDKTVSDGFTDSVLNKIKSGAYNEREDKAIVLKFIKKHLLVAASFIFIILASSSMFFMKGSEQIKELNRITNQNKIQTEIEVKSQLKNNAYYISIIESFFDDNSQETDDIEEEYVFSFLA